MMIKVVAKPKAKVEYVKKLSEDEYEVAVKEPPEDGKANKRIVELLAEYFKKPKSSIKLIKGHSSRVKTFSVE
ncbi:DUF167 domain-containing protein [Thermocrinis minervae]|uniref:UPF0235 protein SAMN05444391_1431 n=1 Tax=Thermocrinis minervae TaxID=381751 RepID=A0A1M6TEZ3_9AQUI|nr:DUF167 domain-containing protein [Thermocrinis minervae]SHK55444.1 hypothetical protein SAMN05444391_1431 [Thermocrinis minervae]